MRHFLLLVVFICFGTISIAAESPAKELCNWLGSNGHLDANKKIAWQIEGAPGSAQEVKFQGQCQSGAEHVEFLTTSYDSYESDSRTFETKRTEFKLSFSLVPTIGIEASTYDTTTRSYKFSSRSCSKISQNLNVLVPASNARLVTNGSNELHISLEKMDIPYTQTVNNQCDYDDFGNPIGEGPSTITKFTENWSVELDFQLLLKEGGIKVSPYTHFARRFQNHFEL